MNYLDEALDKALSSYSESLKETLEKSLIKKLTDDMEPIIKKLAGEAVENLVCNLRVHYNQDYMAGEVHLNIESSKER